MNKFVDFGQKIKKNLLVFIIVWIILVIVVIAPISHTVVDAKKEHEVGGTPIITAFFNKFMDNLTHINRILDIFSKDYIQTYGMHILYFTAIYTVFFLIGVYKSGGSEYKDIEHGSSDWAKGGEQYTVLSKNKGIILAEKHYLPLDKMGNINTLIVGGSGAGKSASYSIPNASQLLGSYVFTDPKGEIYDKTSGYLKANGYEIKVLNLVNPEHSDGYNPLMHIESNLDVDVIANTVIRGQKSEGGSSDPFWDDTSEMLLKALIYYLISQRPLEEQSLASCAEMVRAANTNGGNNLLTDLMSELPYDHPARMNYKSIEIAPEKTYSSILSALQSKLGKFDSKEIADVTSTDTIRFEDIGDKKVALYVISSDTHTAYDFLLTIFFSQLIQKLYNYAELNGGQLKNKVFFILDEFANIGQIPDFDKKISTSRSRGIQFSVILQNLDQLEAVYEKSYETIIGNCDTSLFLGSNSQKTVEYFSKLLGEKTIFRETKNASYDKDKKKSGYSDSKQDMARALMTPDELRRMSMNNCIIYEKGLKPIKADKYFYFKHKEIYAKLMANQVNHNDYKIERGTYRKFNPYKPYDANNDKPQENELKLDSLDDLFTDDAKASSDSSNVSSSTNNDVNTNTANNPSFNSFATPMATDTVAAASGMQGANQFGNNGISQESSNKKVESDDVKMPNVVEETEKNDENDVIPEDLQKQLEAKFDELFGKLDEDDN